MKNSNNVKRNLKSVTRLITSGSQCGYTKTLVSIVRKLSRERGDQLTRILVLTCANDLASLKKLKNHFLVVESFITIDSLNNFCLVIMNTYSKQINDANKLPNIPNDNLYCEIKKNKMTDDILHELANIDYGKSLTTVDDCAVNNNMCYLVEILNKMLTRHQTNKQDTLLLDTCALIQNAFAKDARLLNEVAGQFDVLLVDNLQDASMTGVMVLIQLASNIDRVVIGGDPHQSLTELTPLYWNLISKQLPVRHSSLMKSSVLNQCRVDILNQLALEIQPLQSHFAPVMISKLDNTVKPSLYTVDNFIQQMDCVVRVIKNLQRKDLNLHNIVIATHNSSDLEEIMTILAIQQIDCLLVQQLHELKLYHKIICIFLKFVNDICYKDKKIDDDLLMAIFDFVKIPPSEIEHVRFHVINDGDTVIGGDKSFRNSVNAALDIFTAFVAMVNHKDPLDSFRAFIDALEPAMVSIHSINPSSCRRYLERVKETINLPLKYLYNDSIEPLVLLPSVLVATCDQALQYEFESLILVNLVPGKFSHSLIPFTNQDNLLAIQRKFYKCLASPTDKLVLCYRNDLHPKSLSDNNTITSEAFLDSSNFLPYKNFFKLNSK